MNSTLKKIIIPLLLVVMLPVLSYTFYEITSLNETEEVIQEIYLNQLDAILNSVNQYSDLVITSWVSDINSTVDRSSESYLKSQNIFDELFQRNKSLLQIFMVQDTLTQNGISFKQETASDKEILENVISANTGKVERLFRYIQADYRKVEPLESAIGKSQFLAVLLTVKQKETLAIIEINPSIYIEDVLRPLIIEAAGEKFAISCNSKDDIHEFNFDESISDKEPDVKSNLWILPNYELGIKLKGRTLKGLTAERTYTNLIILLFMNFIIIGGIIFIYRSIRKEIQLAQIKSDFVSNVSHELRTPLALISMFAETLEMGRVQKEEKRNEYYRIISQESNRLSRIVNSILSFSKIEAGKRSYNFSETDLNELIQQIYDNYKFHLSNKNFNFEFVPEENLHSVNIDREAISEAVINLIDNAVKYSEEHKRIVIRTFNRLNEIGVEVKDNGIGISKDDQHKIFDKFFRVSTGLVHNTKGTGLGLTIVKHVIDAHNARIELESEPGKGSTFRIIFNAVKS